MDTMQFSLFQLYMWTPGLDTVFSSLYSLFLPLKRRDVLK